jgi:hypothetical protein
MITLPYNNLKVAGRPDLVTLNASRQCITKETGGHTCKDTQRGKAHGSSTRQNERTIQRRGLTVAAFCCLPSGGAWMSCAWMSWIFTGCRVCVPVDVVCVCHPGRSMSVCAWMSCVWMSSGDRVCVCVCGSMPSRSIYVVCVCVILQPVILSAAIVCMCVAVCVSLLSCQRLSCVVCVSACHPVSGYRYYAWDVPSIFLIRSVTPDTYRHAIGYRSNRKQYRIFQHRHPIVMKRDGAKPRPLHYIA